MVFHHCVAHVRGTNIQCDAKSNIFKQKLSETEKTKYYIFERDTKIIDYHNDNLLRISQGKCSIHTQRPHQVHAFPGHG
jgi:hypothetical protein